MKKIFAFIVILLTAKVSFGQIVQTRPSGMIYQGVGNTSTWYQVGGVLYPVLGVASGSWADTAAMNLNPFIKNIPGFQARTANRYWVRSDDATKWNEYAFIGGSGVGTVTSVGLSLPSIFTVSGSPVTGSGTLTGTLASQLQNLVFASPNGSSGTPTFRAIVAGDLPTTSPYTWQKTLTAGSTLTGVNTIAGGSFAWTHNNAGNYTINASTISLNDNSSGNITLIGGDAYIGEEYHTQGHALINENRFSYEDGIDNAGFFKYLDFESGEKSFTLNAAIGKKSFFIDPTNRLYQMGDINAATSGENFTISGGDGWAYYNNTAHTGFFGINTATPTVALDVVGAVKGTSTATFGVAAGTTGKINLIGTTSGTVGITVAAAAGTYNFNLPTTAGTANQVLTSQGGVGTAMTWTTPSTVATEVPLSGITAATGTNTIDNLSYLQTWAWNSGGGGLRLRSAATASTNGIYTLSASRSGAHASSSITTYAAQFSNSHTGTSSTNIGLELSASDGTVNNALNIAAGALTLNSSAGTSGQVLTSAGVNTLPTWSTPSTVATAVPISGLTAATGTNAIDNGNYIQAWQWGTLSGGGLTLQAASTAAASNGQKLFTALLSGVNANSTQTTYAGQFSNSHTGTGSTNVALDLTASGGATANNALNISAGAIALNGSAGTSGQIFTSGGASTLPAWITTVPIANGGTGATTLAGAGIVTGSMTANYVQKASAATTLTNSLIFDNGTYVGVGTVTPQSKLNVYNGGETGDIISLSMGVNDASGLGSQSIVLGAYEAGAYILYGTKIRAYYNYGASLATDLAFEYSNSSGTLTEGMRINGSGNVSVANGNLTLGTAGNALLITEGSNGRVGQTTLVSGTKAITITGLTTSSRAFVQLVSPSGATLTIQYQAVCTANTLTITGNLAATTINTADGSILNYFVIN